MTEDHEFVQQKYFLNNMPRDRSNILKLISKAELHKIFYFLGKSMKIFSQTPKNNYFLNLTRDRSRASNEGLHIFRFRPTNFSLQSTSFQKKFVGQNLKIRVSTQPLPPPLINALDPFLILSPLNIKIYKKVESKIHQSYQSLIYVYLDKKWPFPWS